MRQKLRNTLLTDARRTGSPKPSTSKPGSNDELRETFLQNVYTPSIKADSPKYKLFGAFDWDLPSKPSFKKPLGENLCIIDLDNRPFDEVGGIFGSEPMSWSKADKVHGLSTGVLNHWLYGMLRDAEKLSGNADSS